MNKHVIGLFGILCGFVLFRINSPNAEVPVKKNQKFQFHKSTLPSSLPSPPSPQEEKKVSFQDEELLPVDEGLPRGMFIAKNIRAIPSKNYKKELGDKVSDSGEFTFFRSETSEEASVVFNKRLGKFHPLTSTIKISEVTPDQRSEIGQEWEEYYYNEELGIQYVKTTHPSLLKDFEALKESGLKVSLEVIQDIYRPR